MRSPACINGPNDGLCGDGDICTGVEACDAVLGCIPCPAGEESTIVQIADATGDGTVPLELPDGIAVDAGGQRLRRRFRFRESTTAVFGITPLGVIAPILRVGDGLELPIGVDVDGAGNVFAAGHVSDSVFKIAPGGQITEVIGAAGDGSNPLSGPVGVAVDDAGNLYVTGFFSDNVFKITPTGTTTQIIDSTGDGADVLAGPEGVGRRSGRHRLCDRPRQQQCLQDQCRGGPSLASSTPPETARTRCSVRRASAWTAPATST